MHPPRHFFRTWPSFLPSLPFSDPVSRFLRDKLPPSVCENCRLVTTGKRPASQIQIRRGRDSMILLDDPSNSGSGAIYSTHHPTQTYSYPPNIARDMGEKENPHPRFAPSDIYVSSGLADAAPWTVRDKAVKLSADGISVILPSQGIGVRTGRSNIAGSSRNGGTI